MRVLVCGGRNYRNYRLIFDTLDALNDFPAYDTNGLMIANQGRPLGLHGGRITQIIHGAGGNTDLCADVWAVLHGYDPELYPASWKRADGSINYSAGPERNARMLTKGKPHLVIAFPGGRGTKNMIYLARAAVDRGDGVTVREITDERKAWWHKEAH